jgi:hypothetical protein
MAVMAISFRRANTSKVVNEQAITIKNVFRHRLPAKSCLTVRQLLALQVPALDILTMD